MKATSLAPRRKQQGQPHRVRQLLPVDLGGDLALELAAFAEAHYGAPYSRLIREALRQFIDARIQAEPVMRLRFVEARERLRAQPTDAIRLIDGGPKPEGTN